MAAPSDDFESADFDTLRACSITARGLWTDMRVLMRRSRRRGYLHLEGKPISLRQLALMTGCTTDEARPLVEELIAVGVCDHSDQEGYFSPRMIAFEEFRRKCSKAGRKGGGNPVLQPIKDGPKVAPKVAPKDGSKDAPPPLSLSPTPPISIPPTSLQNPTGSANAGGRANGSPASGKSSGPEDLPPSGDSDGGAAAPKGSKFPPGVWKRACEGWAKAYRHTHGTDYTSAEPGREWKALSKILTALKGDIERWRAVALAWLKEPEVGKAKGHTLAALADDLGYILNKIAGGKVGQNGRPKPNAEQRGEFREDPIELPTRRSNGHDAA